MITISQISKIFPSPVTREEITVLKDIDFTVNQGEFLSLVGPSGCGKTTLLKIIAGLDPPSRGEIIYRDTEVKKNMAFLFQDPVLFPWKTVLGNVLLPNQVHKHTITPDAAHYYLDQVGLENFKSHYPHELSGGMRARVAIARAFAMQPALFFMDEPFGALDEYRRLQLNMLLLNLCAQIKSEVVFVTHSLSEAILLSDRIMVMGTNPGRIIHMQKVDFPPELRNEDLFHRQEFLALESELRSLITRALNNETEFKIPRAK